MIGSCATMSNWKMCAAAPSSGSRGVPTNAICANTVARARTDIASGNVALGCFSADTFTRPSSDLKSIGEDHVAYRETMLVRLPLIHTLHDPDATGRVVCECPRPVPVRR